MVKAMNNVTAISDIILKSIKYVSKPKSKTLTYKIKNIKKKNVPYKSDNELWKIIEEKTPYGKRKGDVLEQLSSIILQHEGFVISMNGANIKKSNGDNGIDLFGYKEKQQIIVQCKNFDKNPVDVSAIREFVGVHCNLNYLKDFKSYDLIYITSSYYTNKAKQYVNQYNNKKSEMNSKIYLYDKNDLLNKIKQYQIDASKFKSLFKLI